MGSLFNKTYVITGGNSGIGLATASQLVELGANVALFGRNPETLAEAQAALNADVIAVQGDVTRPDDLDRLYSTVQAQFGGLDGLFVNAGIATLAPFELVTDVHIHSVMDTNFTGAVLTIQKALPLLREGASIVLNTSITATLGLAGTSIYSASKAALESLSRTLSAELVGRGIRVNAISPGYTATPIYDRLGYPAADLQAFVTATSEGIPMKRFGTADELARAVVFLLSPDSSYMLGSTLVVDGGRSRL